ncbi:hypothetical protein L511_2646 [Bordetella bronchiseptica MBORD595]|nr:hypothetical protein L511_2646 [Bordetella bronchiseptica MBORD595]
MHKSLHGLCSAIRPVNRAMPGRRIARLARMAADPAGPAARP